ncbi:MAG TPA: hypothetical protein VFQ52_05250 [Rhizomicrobium sp.]|nr:hypothetical protein [Rhizomicrobium sp.]
MQARGQIADRLAGPFADEGITRQRRCFAPARQFRAVAGRAFSFENGFAGGGLVGGEDAVPGIARGRPRAEGDTSFSKVSVGWSLKTCDFPRSPKNSVLEDVRPVGMTISQK